MFGSPASWLGEAVVCRFLRVSGVELLESRKEDREMRMVARANLGLGRGGGYFERGETAGRRGGRLAHRVAGPYGFGSVRKQQSP